MRRRGRGPPSHRAAGAARPHEGSSFHALSISLQGQPQWSRMTAGRAPRRGADAGGFLGGEAPPGRPPRTSTRRTAEERRVFDVLRSPFRIF